MLFAQNLPRVARTNNGLLIELKGRYRLARSDVHWLVLSSSAKMHQLTMKAFKEGTPISETEVHRLLQECEVGLIDAVHQSVLAFGVTFLKSEVARDDEYQSGGDARASGKTTGQTTGARVADTPYTRVGPRGNPAELFVKAMRPGHLFKPGQHAGIRSIEDLSAIIEGEPRVMQPWNVHEPEVGTIVAQDEETGEPVPVAFGPALDMSDRRDEGISALLLTKAKVFWHGAGFGNWFTVPEDAFAFWKTIELQSWVERGGNGIWPIPGEPDTMTTLQCRRPLQELCLDVLDSGFIEVGVSAVFMSGTGIVPAVGDTFSLLPGDQIKLLSEQLGAFDCGVALIPRPRRDLVTIIGSEG